MLVSPAPIAIPVNTANLPTEAVRAEAAQRPQIPQPSSNAKNPSSKNSTEFSEQSRAALQNDGLSQASDKIEEGQSEQSDKNKQEQQQQKSDSRAAKQQEAEEQAIVRELAARDREVRAHEQAHAAVGGNLAGAPSLSFTTGPDGKRYAVSGEVSISVSAVPNNPEATIQKLEQVQRAALAPANPSSQDRKVASQAAASIGQDRSELRLERLRESEEARESRKTKEEEPVDRSEYIGSSEPSSGRLSLDSSGNARASARQQSLQLNLKIVNSGAFDVENNESAISLRA